LVCWPEWEAGTIHLCWGAIQEKIGLKEDWRWAGQGHQSTDLRIPEPVTEGQHLPTSLPTSWSHPTPWATLTRKTTTSFTNLYYCHWEVTHQEYRRDCPPSHLLQGLP
jgi:hypothetical protein